MNTKSWLSLGRSCGVSLSYLGCGLLNGSLDSEALFRGRRVLFLVFEAQYHSLFSNFSVILKSHVKCFKLRVPFPPPPPSTPLLVSYVFARIVCCAQRRWARKAANEGEHGRSGGRVEEQGERERGLGRCWTRLPRECRCWASAGAGYLHANPFPHDRRLSLLQDSKAFQRDTIYNFDCWTRFTHFTLSFPLCRQSYRHTRFNMSLSSLLSFFFFSCLSRCFWWQLFHSRIFLKSIFIKFGVLQIDEFYYSYHWVWLSFRRCSLCGVFRSATSTYLAMPLRSRALTLPFYFPRISVLWYNKNDMLLFSISYFFFLVRLSYLSISVFH